jgi:hypothetical protein
MGKRYKRGFKRRENKFLKRVFRAGLNGRK